MIDGGWTVFLNRFDGSQDFNLNWSSYKYGFGRFEGEFWLGNKKLHEITTQRSYSMKMEVSFRTTGEERYALYDRFWIDEEQSNYTLHISGYSGRTRRDYWAYHNRMMFSTKDRDHDKAYSSCAVNNKGGHWYNKCYSVNPTATFNAPGEFGMNVWYQGHYISLKQMKLKIKANKD